MVERFHRSLKTILKAHLTNSNGLVELPWVLLGLRTVSKEVIGVSVVELVYGEPLTIREEFVTESSSPWSVDIIFLKQTRTGDLNKASNSHPAFQHNKPSSAVLSCPTKAKYVFTRNDHSVVLTQDLFGSSRNPRSCSS